MQKNNLSKKKIAENIVRFSGMDIKQKDVEFLLDLFFDEIKNGLERGQTIELRGFGTFELKQRKEKSSARNPKTGKIVSVKSHKVAIFRPGQDMKKRVWSL